MTSPSLTKPDSWRVRDIETDEKEAVAERSAGEVKKLAIPEGQGSSLAADGERIGRGCGVAARAGGGDRRASAGGTPS